MTKFIQQINKKQIVSESKIETGNCTIETVKCEP